MCEAVFGVLGEGWQRVLAEARIRGQLHSKGDSAVSYLGRSVLPVVGGSENTGDVSFLAFKYETVASDFPAEDLLANPKREVSVEVLRSDPRCILRGGDVPVAQIPVGPWDGGPDRSGEGQVLRVASQRVLGGHVELHGVGRSSPARRQQGGRRRLMSRTAPSS